MGKCSQTPMTSPHSVGATQTFHLIIITFLWTKLYPTVLERVGHLHPLRPEVFHSQRGLFKSKSKQKGVIAFWFTVLSLHICTHTLIYIYIFTLFSPAKKPVGHMAILLLYYICMTIYYDDLMYLWFMPGIWCVLLKCKEVSLWYFSSEKRSKFQY